ncbi:DUF6049 family protein [Bifidobacterium aquikefiri]|uniref:DUF6049 family protein n=2 Tax=Bifidobacterium aquikefiri TaxID=1653207 RepID=UPI0023F0357D|nr:DUF6049 family protein [Bifidobacterium aquikefiri]
MMDWQHTGRYHVTSSARMSHIASALIACITAVFMVAVTTMTAMPAHAAATDAAKTTVSQSTDATDSSCSDAEVGICIKSATAVLTSTSGYTTAVTIFNSGDTALKAGTLTVAMNAKYSFTSRVDMQDWANGDAHIPTPDILGTVQVPQIQAGHNASVNIKVPADDSQLTSIFSWGPKPLQFDFSNGVDKDHASVNSFVTRSTDGLKNADTPPLSVTVVLPLTASSWSGNTDAVKELQVGADSKPSTSSSGSASTSKQPEPSQTNSETNDTNSSSASSSTSSSSSSPENDKETSQSDDEHYPSIVSIGEKAANIQRRQLELLKKYPMMQSIADPLYLQDFAIPPQTTGIMQPADFDITAYAAKGSSAYTQAGISDSMWSESLAQKALQTATGNLKSTSQAYAWQGRGNWTQNALDIAKKQGYSTAISLTDFASDDDSASAHTSKYIVETASGNINVLVAQKQLSLLAQNAATTKSADAETTSAGRLSRLMAQSALYQMEQPYAERVLLIAMKTAEDLSYADQVMSNLSQASWLTISDLATLQKAAAYKSGQAAAHSIPTNAGLSNAELAALNSSLSALAASKNDISRFSTSILSSKEQSGSSSTTSGTSDAQALARGDAAQTGQQSDDASGWISQLSLAQSTVAIHSLDGTGRNDTLPAIAAQLAQALLSGVHITPSESVTVVTETASLPVTVSNDHPYAVHVIVSSKTDSAEIVTAREAQVEIPAHAEVQVTLPIRVAAAGRANASLVLLDRKGQAFGITHNTRITSSLRLSDMSGLAILVVAGIFGMLGLWRQFNRKKDPDE